MPDTVRPVFECVDIEQPPACFEKSIDLLSAFCLQVVACKFSNVQLPKRKRFRHSRRQTRIASLNLLYVLGHKTSIDAG